MGDERRDFDTPGRTNGQHDQTEPVPSPDETKPFAAPDETQASGASDETQASGPPDETRPIAAPDETQPMTAHDQTQPSGAPDETQPFSPVEEVEEPDHTTATPPRPAWAGRAGVSPPPGPSLRDSAPYTQEVPQAQQSRPWWTPVLLGALALGLLGVLILVAWWMGRDDNPLPVETASASVFAPTEPTEPATLAPTTPAASPTAQIVQVPRLVGLDLDAAVAQLDQLGLAYRFEYRQDDAPEGRVIGASPPEGLVVPVQTTVTLVISTGRERSPTPSPTQGVAASATPN